MVLATGRMDQIAWRFVRLVSLIAFALVCATTIWRFGTGESSGGTDRWIIALGVAGSLVGIALVVIAPWSSRLAGPFRSLAVVGGLLATGAGCLLATNRLVPNESTTLAPGMVVISQVLGALLLGSTTVTWMLGHAYLTATKMTIAPLRHFSRVLSWAVGLRLAFMVLSLLLAWWLDRQGGAAVGIIAHLKDAWLVASLRIGVGLIALAAFAYMVSDCVRLRSTQSATGILYFGSVFAFVGELASQQLTLECGWPI